MSDDLLKEISADIRAEKIRNTARRYVSLGVLLLLVVIIAVGIWQYKSWQYHKAIDSASSSYFSILEKTLPFIDGAEVKFDKDKVIRDFQALSNNSPQSIKALSELEAAGLLADQGKIDDASVIWERLRNDETANQDFRSLANLLWIQHHLDSAPIDELQKRINDLLNQQTPWYGLIKESEALLDIRNNKLVEARQILGKLSIDMNVPPGVRQRANQMLQLIAASHSTVNK